MAKILAVAGKGGTGKTTLCALIMRSLIHLGQHPVLGVDADPNSNLGETLGLTIDRTIADVREDIYEKPDSIPSGMDKGNYLQMMMNQVLIEDADYDLLVMGHQEGPGCYCFANNVLRKFSEDLADNYKIMVVDNEAGMEHLSRRTNKKIDELLLVTDHALRGLRAVRRIKKLIPGLKLDIDHIGLVVNRAPEELQGAFTAEVADIGIPLMAQLPDDPNLMTFDMDGRSLIDLPDDSPSVIATEGLVKKIFT